MKFEEAMAEMRENPGMEFTVAEWPYGKRIHMNEHGMLRAVTPQGFVPCVIGALEMCQTNWEPCIEEIELTSDYEFTRGEKNLYLMRDSEDNIMVSSSKQVEIMYATYFPESRRDELESTVQKLNDGKARLI